MKILVLGDIHGEFRKLNELLNKKKPDLIIILGIGQIGEAVRRYTT